MKKFYHVDYKKRWDKNNIINYLNQTSLTNLRKYSLSNHGFSYLHHNSIDSFYELMYELVRFNQFSNQISRLESMFAFENLEDAKLFVSKFRKNQSCNIIEVECDEYNVLDMNWLTGGTGLDLYNKCIHYWSGDITNEPTMECLLKLPVRVVRIVESL